MKKRFMSILLTICMVFTMLPQAAFATEAGAPLCENHQAHNAECGYIEAKDAKPCSHLQKDGSYSCAPVKDSGSVAAPGSDNATITVVEKEYVCNHSDGCGYAEAVKGAPCNHKCEKCANTLLPLPAVMPLAADVSTDDYTFVASSGLLTIKTDNGTTSWRRNESIVGSDISKPNCTDVKSVSIESGVKEIGNSAFYDCASLGSLTIPKDVQTISEAAFTNCKKLTSVTFADDSSLTSIGLNAFYDCASLESLTIPESVQTIGEGAFGNCKKLTSAIPANVTSIGNKAFNGCENLTSVTFSEKITSIGEATFNGCKALTSVHIPASVTTIDFAAFSLCEGLKNVTFADGSKLATIGKGAFSACEGLTSVTIPKSVTKIDQQAFWDCTKLTSVTFEGKDPPTFEADVFKDTHASLAIYVPAGSEDAYKTEPNLASWKTSIKVGTADEGYSFNSTTGELTVTSNAGTDMWCYDTIFVGTDTKPDYTALKSVRIESGVTEIINGAFGTCTQLASVNFAGGSTLVTISGNAFGGCTALTNVTIPKSVKIIGVAAFSGCASLTSVTIPASVEKIDFNAFLNCTKLTSVTFEGKNPPTFEADVFQNTPDDLAIYVPAGSEDKYKNASNLTDYAGKIVTDDGYSFNSTTGALTVTTNAGTTAWRDNTGIAAANVKSVSIGSDVTTISANAFRQCTSLTSVGFAADSTLTTIGDNAFWSCTSLESVNFAADSSLTTIGSQAFASCGSLTSVTIPKGVKIIDSGAFASCASLKSVTFASDSSLTTIGKQAFNSCASLTSVNIPEKVTSIGERAFAGCGSLASVNIPEKVTSIGSEAFRSCKVLTSVDFAEGSTLTTIGESAFFGCTSLMSVNIPESVTSIGNNAFASCTALANVSFKAATPPSFGTDVFKDTFSKLVIYVPTAEAVTTYKEKPNLATWKEKIKVGAAGEGYSFDSGTGVLTVTSDAGTTGWKNDKGIAAANVKSVAFSDGVKVIGDSAFMDCTGLTSVIFPPNSNVTTIGNNAFQGCAGLTSMVIRFGVTSIGNDAFQGCTGLTSVTIAPSVTSIGNDAFRECTLLTSVTFGGTTPPDTFGTEVFKETHNDLVIYVPTAEAVTDYQKVTNLTPWKDKIITKQTAVTSVEVTPKTASVQLGTTQQFSAAVTGTNNPAQTVTWTVNGGKSGTSISTSGLLTVAADETATSLTVTATSTADTAKSGTAAVKVTTTPVVKYTLTVTNGTGGGSYEAGASVTVTANAPAAGKVFDKWTTADGVTFANATAATTTITMPAKAVTVTATYKDTSATMVPVTGVTLKQSAISLYSNASPRSETLTATIAPANATNRAVTWSSSDPAVATVSNGVVTAQQPLP